jgi:hypothetical protein
VGSYVVEKVLTNIVEECIEIPLKALRSKKICEHLRALISHFFWNMRSEGADHELSTGWGRGLFCSHGTKVSRGSERGKQVKMGIDIIYY